VNLKVPRFWLYRCSYRRNSLICWSMHRGSRTGGNAS
jgi:hypothetical protein